MKSYRNIKRMVRKNQIKKRIGFAFLLIIIFLMLISCVGFLGRNSIGEVVLPEIEVKSAICYNSNAMEALQEDNNVAENIQENERQVTVAKTESKCLEEIEVILQKPELPTGCEATSGAMLLNVYGYDVGKFQVADAMKKSDLKESGGVTYGAHPDDAFIGRPDGAHGYGAFPKVLAGALQKVIDQVGGAHTAEPLYDLDEEELLAFIDEGVPLCVWSSMYGEEIEYRGGWYLIRDNVQTDEFFYWPSNEHCVLLVGYDEKTVTVLDPLVGKRKYERTSFFRHYNQVGRYALKLS